MKTSDVAAVLLGLGGLAVAACSSVLDVSADGAESEVAAKSDGDGGGDNTGSFGTLPEAGAGAYGCSADLRSVFART